jgi:hypothetical protein
MVRRLISWRRQGILEAASDRRIIDMQIYTVGIDLGKMTCGWFFLKNGKSSSPLVGGRRLSYSNCKSARKSGTNRTTQAEISNLLRPSFPGRVNRMHSIVMDG